MVIEISLDDGGGAGVGDRERGGERTRSGRYVLKASTYVAVSGFASMLKFEL
jgi:hypothetical protein